MHLDSKMTAYASQRQVRRLVDPVDLFHIAVRIRITYCTVY